MNLYLVTSESVTEGHPDKMCDQISDSILDEYLNQDPFSHVAIETMVSKDTLFIAGEVSSSGSVDVPSVARKVAKDIGYTSKEKGFDSNNCLVLTNINKQSQDINQGVSRDSGIIGAGDQGIMYGFACDESDTYMPITHHLATNITRKLAQVRKNETLPWLYPDGKSQVTMQYNDKGEPDHITSIVVSSHHSDKVSVDYICDTILHDVVYPVIDSKWITYDTKIHINPTGSFTIGGPQADTGLTGRKIIVDTYGGIGKHGGGAFSGKDPSKVDRSAAYMARFISKNIVAAKLARRCEVAIAYAIGRSEPEAVTVNTFDTERIPVSVINEIIEEEFSFSVKDILDKLSLLRPQYKEVASYGHFGRDGQKFKWESTDAVRTLQKKAIEKMQKNLF